MDKELIKKIENTRNEVTEYDGFYISYNPFCNLPMEGGSDSRKEDETALVKDGKFFILYGDYREQMNELAKKGFEAVKEFVDSKPEEKSFWSN